jgi:hypothetical protein
MSDNTPTPASIVERNRRNSAKSTGPKDTSAVRFNAVQHGLRAEGLTELDSAADFDGYLAALQAELAPVGTLETFLVRRIALCLVRLRRAGMMEGEAINGALHPDLSLEDVIDAGYNLETGFRPRLDAANTANLCDTFQRYETANENKLFRALRELERLQRIRRGEAVPPQVALDVGGGLALFGNPAPAGE